MSLGRAIAHDEAAVERAAPLHDPGIAGGGGDHGVPCLRHAFENRAEEQLIVGGRFATHPPQVRRQKALRVVKHPADTGGGVGLDAVDDNRLGGRTDGCGDAGAQVAGMVLADTGHIAGDETRGGRPGPEHEHAGIEPIPDLLHGPVAPDFTGNLRAVVRGDIHLRGSDQQAVARHCGVSSLCRRHTRWPRPAAIACWYA